MERQRGHSWAAPGDCTVRPGLNQVKHLSGFPEVMPLGMVRGRESKPDSGKVAPLRMKQTSI